MSDTDDTPTYAQNIKLNSLDELLGVLKTHKAANPLACFSPMDDPMTRTVGFMDETSLIRWYVTLTSLRYFPPTDPVVRQAFESIEGRWALTQFLNQ